METNLIGVTEAGDPVFDLTWIDWVFDKKNAAILISKNPSALYGILVRESEKRNYIPNIIVHCSITGFGSTKIEPNVPPPEIALDGYRKLANWLGVDRVVLRCDPLFPSVDAVNIAIRKVLVFNVPGTRIRISFADLYPHVLERFTRIGYDLSKLGLFEKSFHSSIDVRRRLIEMICNYPNIDKSTISACGEPGIQSEPCVSKRDCDILGVEPTEPKFKQRFACVCAGNKFELLKNRKQCPHGCVYCYWKTGFLNENRK